MQKHVETPSPDQIHDFLARLVVGSEGSYLQASIRLAYRDLCRTLRGIAGKDPTGQLLATASRLLHDAIEDAVKTRKTQAEFDAWHKTTCEALKATYDGKFDTFNYGQAQKWLNMSVKYCALLGDRRVPGGNVFFDLGHVPIDSVILRVLRKEPDFPRTLHLDPWSGIDDYGQYMEFQKWIRTKYSKPLAAECSLWQEEMTLAQGRGAS